MDNEIIVSYVYDAIKKYDELSKELAYSKIGVFDFTCYTRAIFVELLDKIKGV